MAAIDPLIVQGYHDVGEDVAATTVVRGRALEDLICYVFGLIPGITITHRNELNQFDTEEIDVALFNDGLAFLPNVILIEAKNWSSRVSSAEVSWFLTKLENRGLDFGILVTTKGITGDAADLNAAHHQVALALSKKRKLIVVTTDELKATADTDALLHLLKKKLCDLHVKGTVG